MLNDRQQAMRRLESLRSERSAWLSQWRELSTYIEPRLGRFTTANRNRGDKKHVSIYDRTGSKAARVLAAGMMAGMTSPARPWFRLATPDREMMEYGPVKLWLDEVTRIMRTIFATSNTYRALHQVYQELGVFGTGASLLLEDYDDVVRHYPLTAGEYMIATNFKGEVDTLYREFDLTVYQIVTEFGVENVSPTVRSMFESSGNLDAWITVVHVIEPRKAYDPKSPLPRDKAWKSCYFEKGADPEKYLREGGYARFPVLAPRWACAGGDIYGNSPGMEAIGAVKELQHKARRKAQVIDYKTQPPLALPAGMKGQEGNFLPGGVTYYTGDSPAKAAALFEPTLDLQHLGADILDTRAQVESAFYSDLFLMLANMERTPQMTAREIAERHEEKLLMLGPIIERLHNELLKPKIDITFDRMLEAGILPPVPKELEGQDLDVDFVSMLAQAQRAVSTSAIDRLLGTVGGIARIKPDVVDKIDADQLVDEYADMLGVDAKLIVPDDQVAAIREQRAKAQAAQAQAEQVPQMASAAKTLSETDTVDGDSALNSVVNLFSGVGAV